MPILRTLSKILSKFRACGAGSSSSRSRSRSRRGGKRALSGMAWRSGGATNGDLVNNLWRNGLITSERVRDAMLKVDRAHYCPNTSSAYADAPQSIGHSATISAPHMHASACESLLPFLRAPPSSPSRAVRVLDVGAGSGYLTHVLAELVFDSRGFADSGTSMGEGKGEVRGKGQVVGIEHISALTELGEGNMRKSAEGRMLLDSGRVKFVTGDGRKGWNDPDLPSSSSEDQGYDAIHVGAGAKLVHKELVAQLRSPGRMFIPVDDEGTESGTFWGGGGGQHIWIVDRDVEGKVSMEKLYGVQYVPLTDAPK